MATAYSDQNQSALMLRVRLLLPRLGLQPKTAGIRWATTSARSGVPDHWTAEKLKTNDEYPLSQELSEKVHPLAESIQLRRRKGNSQSPKKKTATKSYSRPQIVSPGLCGTSHPEVIRRVVC